MEEHERQRQQRARELIRKIRPHASFFHWPVKSTAEFRIVCKLLDGVGDAMAVQSVRRGHPDPPDVIGDQKDGGRVAIEVTELVDEQVTAHNVRVIRESEGEDFIERGKKLVQRDWDRPGLIAAIEQRLMAKDAVTLNGGPFARYVVVLHTDEMMLTHTDAEGWLRDHTFEDMRQVTEAYVLFSHDPTSNSCPYIRLNVSRRGEHGAA